MRESLICFLVTLFIVLLLFACGGGESGPHIKAWGTPELIETTNTGSAQNDTSLAMDNNGNALAMWSFYESPFSRSVWFNNYNVNKGWETEEKIGVGTSEGPSDPQVKFDANGNALAIWVQYDPPNPGNKIGFNHFTQVMGWGTPDVIDSSFEGAWFPHLSVNDNGDAMLVWSNRINSRSDIIAYNYSPTNGWSAGELIETNDATDANNPRVSIDSNGNAIAIWDQSDGTHKNIWVNTYTVSNGWGTPELIESDNSGDASYPQIIIDSSGNAIAVWMQSDGLRLNIWANHYTPGVGWSVAEIIEVNDSGGAHYPMIGVDSSGNAISVWMHEEGTRLDVWANTYTVGSGWGNAGLIESNNLSDAMDPQVAFDLEGNAIVVWGHYHGDVGSNRYTAGEGWGGMEMIGVNEAVHSNFPQIAIDNNGNALAVWSKYDGARTRIWANRYE